MKLKTANIILSLIVLLNVYHLHSQNIIWQSNMGGQQEDYGNALCKDNSGNIIVTGSYQDICYGVGFALYSSGNSDIFLQKLNPNGAIVWTKQFGNINSDNSFSVVTDSNGNIFVSGVFQGSVNFGGSTLTSTNTDPRYFLLKLDTDGNILWKRTIRGSYSSRPKLVIDDNNNLFMTGIISSTSAYDSFTLNPLNGDIFVLKLNSNTASIDWIKQFGSTTVRSSSSSIAVDHLGNVVVTGSFINPAVFGTTTIAATEFHDRNSFTLKLNSIGDISWFKRIEGVSQGTAIAIDSNNNIYTAGNYKGPSIINGAAYNTTTPNNYSVYFQKTDSLGNLIWIKNYNLTTTDQWYALPILTVSPLDLVFLRMLFRNSIQFENQNFTEIISTVPYNILKSALYSCHYPDGTLAWVKQCENPGDNLGFGSIQERGQAMVADETALYFTCSNVTFDDIRYSQQSGANVFTAKLMLPELQVSAFDSVTISVYPNPTSGKVVIDFGITPTKASIELVNLLGQTLARYQCNDTLFNFDINTGNGAYLIKITTEKGSFSKKIVVK